jgi:uncharacterized membrane protein SirB2
MGYQEVKLLHMICAALSISGFSARAALKFAGSAILQQRWMKIVPHCIDTVLLSCAVYLAIASGQYPFSQHWLTAKVLALLVYIVAGMVVLKYASNQRQRTLALIVALASFGYILAAAFSRSVLPWL